MIEAAGPPLSVVELGAGSASKTRHLLQALLHHQGRGHYMPVDVSPSALAQAQHEPLELKQRIQSHWRGQCRLCPGDLNACALILQWQGRTDHPLPRPLAIAAKFDDHSRLTPLTPTRYKPSMIST